MTEIRPFRFLVLSGLVLSTAVCSAVRAKAPADAVVIVSPPRITTEPRGRHVIEEVTLTNDVAEYTLRYEYIERRDDPNRIDFAKWAPTIGYTPLGIASPSMACWYNQGFFIWTLDDLNIQSFRARMRVIHETGPDAMVEYVWDTPKARVSARFALTRGSDKLLFFGRIEPRTTIRRCKLRLMAYPATFRKPHVRSMTTALRTLRSGSAGIDLGKEHWILLEDTAEGRPADGSAGLLLGDPDVFAGVTVDGIGGYGEYVNLVLKPGATRFALGLYECPELPDPYATRAYFKRIGDRESAHLAALLHSDLDQPLSPMPADPERRAALLRKRQAQFDRPAETWNIPRDPVYAGTTPSLPGPPLRTALFCPRWAAYETMELARRLPMDVRHLYYDTSSRLVDPRSWPYRGVTGVGALNHGAALARAVRIVSDPAREVFLFAGIAGKAVPASVRRIVLERVRKEGRLLVLAGGASVLSGWPPDLTRQPEPDVVTGALSAIPWDALPGLIAGDKGRPGTETPWKVWRYGKGRVLVFRANIGPYSALVPLTAAANGLDGAADRILWAHALVLRAAAGRPLPDMPDVRPAGPVRAGSPCELRITAGTAVRTLRVRIQDDWDERIRPVSPIVPLPSDGLLRLPPLPAGAVWFVDVFAMRDPGNVCSGLRTLRLTPDGPVRVKNVTFDPVKTCPEALVPTVPLADGGELTCTVRLTVPESVPAGLEVRCEVRDCFRRVLARGEAPVREDATAAVRLALPPPVTVAHRLDVLVLDEDRRPLAVARRRFTVNKPYPYDDFTVLLWSYARGELVTRRVQRACWELGADMMDLCHMRGYSDEAAAREYAVAAESGLRLLPYVARIAMDDQSDHTLKPGLFNEHWISREIQSIVRCSRQAAPWRPAAYTLGDENYLSRGRFETGAAPETMAAFRRWLQQRYGSITKLNAVWKTGFANFADIRKPMFLDEAARQTATFAPFFDHLAFLDDAFAGLHERLARVIREQDPGAKVGWDGLLGYHWLAGYDFDKLTRDLDLNQVYTTHFLQGELVRSLKRPGALTGEWGNAIADNADGFAAIAWHNLFRGHNSCWWWTSWGCDYTPFNPDLSLSPYGKAFFSQNGAPALRRGVGKLLLHAQRDDSGIAIWYCQADLFAAQLARTFQPKAVFAGDHAYLDDLRVLARALEDLGLQYRFVAAARVTANPGSLNRYRVLFLPLATCLSDEACDAIRAFAARGGLVIADGRTGILTLNGGIRTHRPLDDLFGIHAIAGLEAFRASGRKLRARLESGEVTLEALEPGLKPAPGGAQAAVQTGGTPLVLQHAAGNGRAVCLNFAFRAVNPQRKPIGEAPILRLIARLLAEHGIRAPAVISRAGGGDARGIEQTLFREGPYQYLAVQQDIYQRGLPPQDLRIRLRNQSAPGPALVVDIRTGSTVWRRNETDNTPEWTARISRGYPLLYAILPGAPSGISLELPEAARPGEAVRVAVTIAGVPRDAFHVVHMSIFAPGSKRPHRQYSVNIACPGGRGEAVIPFALNDPPGTWTVAVQDAATGLRRERRIRLQPVK